MIKFASVEAKYKTVFDDKINQMLEDGWNLYGYPIINFEHYFQAFTRSTEIAYSINTVPKYHKDDIDNDK